jgi:hypothetical protein
MSRNIDREEYLRIAAERIRIKKEKEEREEKDFYKHITTGTPWFIFRLIVFFCALLAILTTIDQFVDGSAKKIAEDEWEIDRNWEWTWHKIVEVEGYTFAPELEDWHGRVENSMSIIYSPIFRAGKKLSYDIKEENSGIRKHEEIRWRSIFTWFPALQLLLLLPLIPYFFKRERAWFNFARLASMYFIFPLSILLIFVALL